MNVAQPIDIHNSECSVSVMEATAYRITVGMVLTSRRHGTTHRVVGCTATDYLIETDGHVSEWNSAELHHYFTRRRDND